MTQCALQDLLMYNPARAREKLSDMTVVDYAEKTCSHGRI